VWRNAVCRILVDFNAFCDLSGGKTLVSEILMLHRLALAQKQRRNNLTVHNRGFGTILFVVPFVALAEVSNALQVEGLKE
jgi:hypothetical protein